MDEAQEREYRRFARSMARKAREHLRTLGGPKDRQRAIFWQDVHRGLSLFSDRLDDETLARAIASVHARVPLPTLAEQRAERARYKWLSQIPVFAELTNPDGLIFLGKQHVAEARAHLPAVRVAFNRVRQAVQTFADRIGCALEEP
jgi:hypothetical protein